jgi:hypothetical protein
VALAQLAAVAAAQGQPLKAARLLGAAAVLHEASANPQRLDHDRQAADLRAALGEAAFAAAWAEGRAMPLEAAVSLALQEPIDA